MTTDNASAPLAAEDDLAVRRVLALFSHVFDNGRHDLLHLVFSEDMILENTIGNGFVHKGIEDAIAFTRRFAVGTLDHHTVDSVIWRAGDGVVRSRSRYLAIIADGAIHNGDYLDELANTTQGWRIRHRITIPRIPKFDSRAVDDAVLAKWELR